MFLDNKTGTIDFFLIRKEIGMTIETIKVENQKTLYYGEISVFIT